MYKNSKLLMTVLATFTVYIFYASNANPSWIKFPDSHYYLDIAISWAQGHFVLDDGTGTFVRPVAFLVYGIGYWIGGFDGLYLFSLGFSFLLIFYATYRAKLGLGALLFAYILAPGFANYANSILLQILSFSLVAFIVFQMISESTNFLENSEKKLSLLLLTSVFIHGGMLFLWLGFICAVSIWKVQTVNYNQWLAFKSIFETIASNLIILLLALTLMELLFDEPVIRSFYGESGFQNNLNDYYVGSFVNSYLQSFARFANVPLLSLVILCAFCLVAWILAIVQKDKLLGLIGFWLFTFLAIFEIFTVVGLMKRSAFASEYQRVFFSSSPLFIAFIYLSMQFYFKLIQNQETLRGVSKTIVQTIIVFLSVMAIALNSTTVVNSFNESAFALPRNLLSTYRSETEPILVLPSTVYQHRKFLKHRDFSDMNVQYYSDFCFNEDIIDPHLSDFNNFIIINNPSLLDMRLLTRLDNAGCDTSSIENYVKNNGQLKWSINGISLYEVSQ